MIGAKNTLLLGLALVLVNTFTAYFAITFQYDSLHSENSTLENTQVVLLVLAAVGYLSLHTPSQDERIIHVAIALLSFSFILREIDLEHLNLPSQLIALGSGLGRKILLAVLWISLCTFSYLTIVNRVSFIKKFVTSNAFSILTAAFLLLVISAVMDKQMFSLTHYMLFEELAETNAYLLIALPVMFRAERWVQKTVSICLAEFVSAAKARNKPE